MICICELYIICNWVQRSGGYVAGGVRGAAPAKASVDQAKIYFCSEFIRREEPQDRSARDRPMDRGSEFNVITGGDNGYLYLWENCVCINTVRASRGAVQTIKVKLPLFVL